MCTSNILHARLQMVDSSETCVSTFFFPLYSTGVRIQPPVTINLPAGFYIPLNPATRGHFKTLPGGRDQAAHPDPSGAPRLASQLSGSEAHLHAAQLPRPLLGACQAARGEKGPIMWYIVTKKNPAPPTGRCNLMSMSPHCCLPHPALGPVAAPSPADHVHHRRFVSLSSPVVSSQYPCPSPLLTIPP